ncbi:MAG: hypothetical protein HC890_13810 [Chloroflexaceae bacterium]|nr:hypothetical protein [Chloroflexaceae bacterium]
MNNLVDFSALIGTRLTVVNLIEDRDLSTDELCLTEAVLIFEERELVILTPLPETDEIEISINPPHDSNTFGNGSFCKLGSELVKAKFLNNEQSQWYRQFYGHKLQAVWVSENNQGYQDLITFAFGQLHPSFSLIAEGSVLKVFVHQQVRRRHISQDKLQTRQL